MTPSTRPGGGTPWLSGWWLSLFLLLVVGLAGCGTGLFGGSTSLLARRTPSRSEGVMRPEVLADGVKAINGDPWESDLAAIFRSPASFVEYDLGEPKDIVAAYAHGDNNDTYQLEGSLDGKSFKPFWTIPPVSGPGLQPRSSADLRANVRYLRVRPKSGDRSFSLSEIAVYSERPDVFPPPIAQRRGLPKGESVRTDLVMLAFALGAWLFLVWRRAPLVWVLICSVLPLVAGYGLWAELARVWPVDGREVSLVRGLAAGLAGLAVLREILLPRTFPAHRPVVLGVLSVAAFAAFSGFFNLYHPQFQDQKQGTPLFVHNFDMRVYYPVAKYFPELRFNGLYRGSVAAMVDDVPGLTLDDPRFSRAEMRNLRTHRMERVVDVKTEITEIRQRFSPERWEAFKADMRYFRETMGERDYLGSMHDHGGNATPLWLAIAHLLFMGTTANNSTLALTGLLDPILLLLAFAAIWRTFGMRTALVSVAVWGANDFYMFGSNWGGATLRHDWMAYLALGLCALKARRHALGGALLALSAMIRAFPALSLVVMAAPPAWYVVDFWRAHRRLPRRAELLTTQRPFLLALAGAAGCVVFCFLFSSLLFSFDAWLEWVAKVRLLDRDPHVNHVSLRALVAGSGGLQPTILRARWPLFATGIALHVVALGWAARGKSLDQAAILGSLLIPIVFNPANYYIHYVFVVPLLAIEVGRRQRSADAPAIGLHDAAIWGCLLAMCAGQYWTTLVRDLELHFQLATILYFAATLPVIGLVLWRDWETIAITGTPLASLAGGGAQPAVARGPVTTAASAASTAAVAEAGTPDAGEEASDERDDEHDEDGDERSGADAAPAAPSPEVSVEAAEAGQRETDGDDDEEPSQP
ncbi:MAG TPA: hypothetical protein PLU22_03385 [Polyangiaceae bacterium]|nr:hypothetical protein [Polyangiaceae bacterium]